MNPRSHGFTLLEVAVLFTVLSLLAVMVYPELTGRRRGGCSHRMTAMTHLVGIHKGMILYAQGNKDHYPGLTSDGSEAPAFAATATTVGSGGRGGYHLAHRLALMMNGNYFSPEYVISPMEMQPKTPPQLGQEMTSANYSFAMLRLGDPAATGRRKEWTTTQNSRAAVASDRNLGPGPGKAAYSNQTTPADGWRGSVVYGDNHGVFETSNLVKTAYGDSETTLDDLFDDDKDDAGAGGNDAAMVYHDARSYVSQK